MTSFPRRWISHDRASQQDFHKPWKQSLDKKEEKAYKPMYSGSDQRVPLGRAKGVPIGKVRDCTSPWVDPKGI